MSCNANSKIAGLANHISGGISRLSSQQAFYAGLALGAGGLAAGAGIGIGVYKVAQRWQRRNPIQPISRPVPRPAMTRSQQPKPIPTLTGGKRAAGSSRVRPARAAGQPIDKTPKPIPALTTYQEPTQLEAAPIRTQAEDGKVFTAEQGYRVIRADGAETGLAVTPRITKKAETGEYSEDTSAWGVTHAGSGSLVSGPYQTVAAAHELATRLAPLRWTAARLPAGQVEKAKTIITAYQAELAAGGADETTKQLR